MEKFMEILGSIWFTNKDGCTGIVRVQTEYDGIKYFIGRVQGYNQRNDEEYLANWGSTFPTESGNVLFGV
jgi:hypothetical protein